MAGYDTSQRSHRSGSLGGESAVSEQIDLKAAAATSGSKIRDRISHCEENLSGIHSLLDEFEKRLDVILTPQAPQAVSTEKDSAPQAPQSHLTNRLEAFSMGLNIVAFKLHKLIGRIEI